MSCHTVFRYTTGIQQERKKEWSPGEKWWVRWASELFFCVHVAMRDVCKHAAFFYYSKNSVAVRLVYIHTKLRPSRVLLIKHSFFSFCFLLNELELLPLFQLGTSTISN